MTFPSASVARAVRRWCPGRASRHVSLYGGAATEPIGVGPLKKSTLVTADLPGATFASNSTGAGVTTHVPSVGLASVTRRLARVLLGRGEAVRPDHLPPDAPALCHAKHHRPLALAIAIFELEVRLLPGGEVEAGGLLEGLAGVPVVHQLLPADPQPHAVVGAEVEMIELGVRRLDLPRPAGGEELGDRRVRVEVAAGVIDGRVVADELEPLEVGVLKVFPLEPPALVLGFGVGGDGQREPRRRDLRQRQANHCPLRRLDRKAVARQLDGADVAAAIARRRIVPGRNWPVGPATWTSNSLYQQATGPGSMLEAMSQRR